MAKILIIEDEPCLRENLIEALEMEQFETLSAKDGRQGIVFAQRDHPDLILCDVTMPGLDGYGVLQALRKDPATARIPFVFLTALSEHADVRATEQLRCGA